MTNPHVERLTRAREQLAERGVDALLLGPSADLVHLTGYDALLTERLTLLVLPAKGEPRLRYVRHHRNVAAPRHSLA